MRTLLAFNHTTLDGYFTGQRGDMSWAYGNRNDAEFNAFAAENAKGNGTLLFGRVTYQLMAGYWPTPMAFQNDPIVAEGMNRAPKIVFSRTLGQAAWQNTTLIQDNLAAEVRKLKQQPGEGMAILGSGSIVSQLAQEGLIDEYHLIVNPIALGAGRTMFEGLKQHLSLKLTKSRTFSSGRVLLCYQPA